jgi:Uma2 family endonuclease
MPDLVIEVLSPGTARVDKLRLYGQHGAREYWIVDPGAAYVEVYVAAEGGLAWQGVYGPQERFRSAVLAGGEVDLARVFGT